MERRLHVFAIILTIIAVFLLYGRCAIQTLILMIFALSISTSAAILHIGFKDKTKSERKKEKRELKNLFTHLRNLANYLRPGILGPGFLSILLCKIIFNEPMDKLDLVLCTLSVVLIVVPLYLYYHKL